MNTTRWTITIGDVIIIIRIIVSVEKMMEITHEIRCGSRIEIIVVVVVVRVIRGIQWLKSMI